MASEVGPRGACLPAPQQARVQEEGGGKDRCIGERRTPVEPGKGLAAVGRALYVLAGAQQVLPFRGDKQQVGVHDGVVGQPRIAAGVEEPSEPAVGDVVAQLVSEQGRDDLVGEVRGRSDYQFTVQQLEALVRQRGAVVLVGELGGGLRGGHVRCSPLARRDGGGVHDSASRRRCVPPSGSLAAQQMDRGAVRHAVGMEALGPRGRRAGLGAGEVLLQAVVPGLPLGGGVGTGGWFGGARPAVVRWCTRWSLPGHQS